MIMLFAEVLEMWWMGNMLNMRETSAYLKRERIDKHVLPYFGNIEIENLTDCDVNNFIIYEREHGNRLTGQGMSINQIIEELRIVRSVCIYAERKHIITDNPFDLIRMPKREPPKEYGIFSYEEVQTLIEVARPKWLGDMILLVYNTGMRKCECFGLQWQNIDFKHKRLRVERSVRALKPGDRYISIPKTRTANRIVLLDDVTIEMLKRRFEKRTSDTWVFADKYGELLSPWYLVKYFGQARRKVGIVGKRFYDLRHTHITDIVAAGESLPVVQKRVGHSNINMTMHYTHIKPDMQDDIVALLNKRNKR